MKETYLRQVGRLLPRRLRRDVLRDLEEQFDTAAEHGESAEDVVARLGTPEEFAAPFREGYRPSLVPPILLGSLGLLISAFCGVLLWLQHQFQIDVDESIAIIGGMDGPTQIYVSSDNLNPLIPMLIGGIVLIIAGCVWLRKRRKLR